MDVTFQVGEAANPGAKTLVAQDASEEEERLQAAGAGAPRGGQPDQRTRHRQGARQVPAPPHQNVVRTKQYKQVIEMFNKDSRIRDIRKGWVTVLRQ